MRLGKTKKTARGFKFISFKDIYDTDCSLQESSLATEGAIWLGVSEANPMVLASEASKFGIKTKAKNGWVPFPLPPEVHLSVRMHLNREKVAQLIQSLKEWMRDGELK